METTRSYAGRHYLRFTLLAVLLVIGVASQFLLANKGDKNWLLMAADLWIGGKRLYVDIFEVNPPLIVWLFSLAVRLAHLLSAQANHMLVMLALLLSALSIYASSQVIALHPQFTGNKVRLLNFSLLTAFLLIQLIYPSYFADREHVFTVLVLPYLLCCLPALPRRNLPPRLRILVGIMAGIGFCIKPQTLVIFLPVQLMVVMRERRLAIIFCLENILIYVTAVIYIGAAWFFFPEFFHEVLPMALITYGAYKPVHYIGNFVAPLLSLATAAADFRLRNRSPFRSDMYYLLVLNLAAILYVFMNNGWGYTFVPLNTLNLLLVAWIWWEYLWLTSNAAQSAGEMRRYSQGATACIVVFTVNAAIMLVYIAAMLFVKNPVVEQAAQKCMDRFETIIMSSPNPSYGSISETFYLWLEFYRDIPAKYETRYHAFWMMPKFHEEDKTFTEKYRWITDEVARDFTHDVTQNQPGAVLVENKATYILDYLNANPAFVSAWQQYERVPVPDECGFAVYQRHVRMNPKE